MLDSASETWFPLDLIVIGLFVLLGFEVGRLVAPRTSRLEKLAMSLPIGSGLLTYFVFLFSWVGFRINLGTVIAGYGILLGLIEVCRWRSSEASPAQERSMREVSERSSVGTPVLWTAIICLGLVSAVLGVVRSHIPWDAAAIWAPKGYGIALEGTIFAGRGWGGHGLGYPLNIPLMISVFQLIDGDILPGSKLIFSGFFVSILLGVVAFWRRVGVSDDWAAIGVILIGTVPEIFRHSTYGYVNIPFAAYVVLGSLYAVLGLARGSRNSVTLGGILLALGCWTRVEGILYAVAVFAALVVLWSILRPPGKFPAHLILLPVLAIGGVWAYFYRMFGTSGSEANKSMSVAIEAWRHGDFALHSIRLILGVIRRSLLRTDVWGLMFPLSISLLILRFRSIFSRSVPEIPAVALLVASTGLSTGFLFYVGSYTSVGLVGWLSRGFPRAFFPTAILLLVLVILAAGHVKPTAPAAELATAVGVSDREA